MNVANTVVLLACAAPFVLTGCSPVEYRNARILSHEDAKVAITINGDLSNTVINTNTGEPIEPCKIDPQLQKRSGNEVPESCYPEGFNPNGEVLADMEITVIKGSTCITIVSASRYYVFCDPPYKLGL